MSTTIPRPRSSRPSAFGLAALLGSLLAVAGLAERPDFDTWLSELRAEARARKISSATLDAMLTEIRPLERVIELDRKQPEGTMTFAGYLDLVVSPRRVETGRARLREHGEVLERIREAYDVQPRFIVALWGVESDYGRRTGGFPVVEALATLAYDGRRSAFFRAELLDALQIADEGHVEPARMLGSWAGAMGQPQFMPSSFRSYAVDFDGDERRDIWNTTDDVLASAANYLARSGWRGDERWGREVRLPDDLDPDLVGTKVRRPLAAWATAGVRRADGSALPRAEMEASIVQPDGPQGRSFLVYGNYRALLRWNRSDYFATAVGILSDRIR
jgi:membrane-bound lytic murein transglycosylase B